MKLKFLTPGTFFLAVLAALCCCTLFLSSSHFVSREVSLKWFGLIAGIALTGIIPGFLQRRVYIHAKSVFLLISVSCFPVFFRDWAVSGFNVYLLTQTFCLIFLFFVLQQAIPVLPPDICLECLLCWRQRLHFRVYCSMQAYFTAQTVSITNMRREAEMYSRYKQYYGYVFYIGKKI